ncbi:MAG: hypothetical protein K2N05_07585 [Muribaculaceae bacterium]|nr:hypothetical protein [Muribaculaceae bacterium]
MKKIWNSIFLLFVFFLTFLNNGILFASQNESKELTKALEYLEKYNKTGDSGYRRLFQEYLSDAAENRDSKAEYLYYQFSKHRPYNGEVYEDIRLSDSLAYVYLERAAVRDYLPALGEMGHLYSQGVYNGYHDIKKNRNLGFDCLKRAESLNDPDIHLALAHHYIGQSDSITNGLANADAELIKVEKFGNKKYFWPVLKAKANIAFLKDDFKTASGLYKKWLEKSDQEIRKAFQGKWMKMDENFVAPDYDDLAMAAGSFMESGDIQLLTMVTTGNDVVLNSRNYDEPKIKMDLSIWDSSDQGKINLHIMEIVNDYFVRGNRVKGNRLKKYSFLPTLYSYSEAFPSGFYLDMSRYYKKTGNYNMEKEVLKKGSEKGNRNCSLILASRYFYGSDDYPKDLDSCYEYLGRIESDMLSNKSMSGEIAAKAAYLLSKIYYTSDFSHHDYKKAVSYANRFRNVKGFSNQSRALSDIYRLLSNCYRFGRGVEIDEKLADEYLSHASEEGDPDAKEIVEWFYGEKKMVDSSNNP